MNEGKSIYMHSCWMPWLLLALCIIQPLVTCHCITGSLWVTSSYSLTTDARKAVQSRGCDWASLQAARGCQISPECLRSPSRNLCFIPLAGTVSEKDGQRGSVYFIVKKGIQSFIGKEMPSDASKATVVAVQACYLQKYVWSWKTHVNYIVSGKNLLKSELQFRSVRK